MGLAVRNGNLGRKGLSHKCNRIKGEKHVESRRSMKDRKSFSMNGTWGKGRGT